MIKSVLFLRLQLDRKVLDHDLPRKPVTLTIHFFVKFFIESISHLTENRTVELFYLQARSLIFRGTLEVEPDIVFQLAALSLQVNTCSLNLDPPDFVTINRLNEQFSSFTKMMFNMIHLFQAGAGDFVDASTTRNLVKKSPVLPAGVLKEHPSLTFCEDQVRIIAFTCHLYLVK